MNSCQQYTAKAKEYCALLKEFADGNDEYNRLFDVLDCLKLDESYTLALHRANTTRFVGDVSWFYCYEGIEDIYKDKYNHPNEDEDEDFFQCFGNLSEFEIFEHIQVEKTLMGAWQAFLLSIAVSQLPCVQHGVYRHNDLVFANKDIKLSPWGRFTCYPHKSFNNKLVYYYPEEYLYPDVWFKYSKAVVRHCYFNPWQGVVRKTTAISFNGNKITDFETINREVLYESKPSFIL